MSGLATIRTDDGAAGQPVDEAVRRSVRDFLLLEAELLDDGRFRDWLNLLAADVDYRMPVRVTRDRTGGPGFDTDAYHFIENRFRLEIRIERLETGAAWAEEPPSRTRHFVSNIRVGTGTADGEVQVKSNLLLYRTRGSSPHHDLLSAERHDVLRQDGGGQGGGWKLARRRILLDQTTMATHNLSIFL
jgi:3-phenylpropionate/cinnamic acid dioxygenase small subunit